MAPKFEPLLKMPVAKARSRLGNHSATVLMEAGKLPASPTPNALRTKTCIITNRPTKALRMPNTDQTISERARPSLVPIRSMTQPARIGHSGVESREEAEVKWAKSVLDQPNPPWSAGVQKKSFR